MKALNLILAKDSNGDFALWACRGEGKGCPRNRYRKTQAICDDCVGPLPEDMTIGEVEQNLSRGNA